MGSLEGPPEPRIGGGGVVGGPPLEPRIGLGGGVTGGPPLELRIGLGRGHRGWGRGHWRAPRATNWLGGGGVAGGEGTLFLTYNEDFMILYGLYSLSSFARH